MIESWNEIERRFDAIKDHKPRATKKLQELGEILASAYLLSPEKADDMWQYIIELNVSDDITYSKYYIAQVFRKLYSALPIDAAVSFVMMRPERVRLMLLHGYDGSFSTVDILYLLIGFLISQDKYDEAIILTSYISEKYKDDEVKLASMLYYFSNRLCHIGSEADYSEDEEIRIIISDDNKRLYFNQCIESFPNSVIWAISCAELMIHNIPGIRSFDVNKCLQVLCNTKAGYVFAKLLFYLKDNLSESQAIGWVEEYCVVGSLADLPLFASDTDRDIGEAESQVLWFHRLIINSNSLLELAFTQLKGYEISFPLMKTWIESGEWDSFIRYLVLALNNADDDRLSRYLSEIKATINRYREYKRSKLKGFIFGDSPSLTEKNVDAFADALGKVCVMTDGIMRHNELTELLRSFVSDEFGSVEKLNRIGIDVQIDKRSTIQKMRDYCADGLGKVAPYDTSYFGQKIQEFIHSIDQENTTYGYITAYMLIPYPEITDYVFLHNAHEASLKANMILGCLVNKNVKKAFALYDCLVETTRYPNYSEKNGWSQDFKNAVTTLLRTIKLQNESEYSESFDDQVTKDALAMADSSMQYFSEIEKKEVKSLYLQLAPKSESLDSYISSILADTNSYIEAVRLPKTKIRYWDLQKSITDSFLALARANRLDAVAAIMRKVIVENRIDIVNWTRGIYRLEPLQVSQLVVAMPEVFKQLIDRQPREQELLHLATTVGKSGNRQAFCQLKQYIVQSKGFVNGLNDCFDRIEENYTPIQVVSASNVVVGFLYFDESRRRRFYYGVSPKDNARRWVFEAFFRVSSQDILITKLGIDDLEINGIPIDDDEIELSYDGNAHNGVLKLSVYSDFYDGNENESVRSIRFKTVVNRNSKNCINGPKKEIGYDFVLEQFVEQ